ncbi:sugar transferase [Cohnella cellulosilytica]|uniref:Sugar transferase n=1 Tax=Cohnella cellulosilytica TaxID=986710 RepID=A0ABW2FK23_9BACL
MPNSKEANMEIASTSYASYTPYTLSQTRTARSAYDRVKRIVDLVLTSAALPLLAPFMLLIALAVKLEEPSSPALYTQTRLGKDGKPFRIYKFRSMIGGAEKQMDRIRHLNEVEGAMFKIKNDPRITRTGRFLRKTSLDELPQLFNVLRGDMSLVGPRPPLPEEVERYTGYDLLRLQVKPGCTGLWQVSGRNRLHFAEMVEMDLDYIERRSVWLDFKLILKTVVVMFKAKDAY